MEREMQMTGACKGCASSSVTLKKGVEQMMKHYIPEVTSEKELRKDFEDEMAAAIADEIKKMKKRR